MKSTIASILISILIVIPHIADAARPRSPTNLRVRHRPCEHLVTLNWEDRSDNEDGFIIYRLYMENPDNVDNRPAYLREFKRVSRNTRSCQDWDIDVSHGGFKYWVFAYNADGTSADSAFGSETLHALLQPPGDFRVLEHRDRVRFRWFDRSRSELGHRLYRKAPSQAPVVVADIVSTDDPGRHSTMYYTDTGAVPYVECAYTVEAYHRHCAPQTAGPLYVTYQPKIATPVNLRASSAPCSGAVTLTWTDVEHEDSYLIKRSNRPVARGGWDRITAIKRIPPNSRSYADNTVPLTGIPYYYSVIASGPAEDSDPAGVRAVAHGKPPAPGNVTATPRAAEGNIEVRWQDVENELGYKIFRRIRYNRWTLLGNVPQNITRYLDDVAPDRIYYYKIQAHNRCGNSAYSDAAQSAIKEIEAVPRQRRVIRTPRPLVPPENLERP